MKQLQQQMNDCRHDMSYWLCELDKSRRQVTQILSRKGRLAVTKPLQNILSDFAENMNDVIYYIEKARDITTNQKRKLEACDVALEDIMAATPSRIFTFNNDTGEISERIATEEDKELDPELVTQDEAESTTQNILRRMSCLYEDTEEQGGYSLS